tara:strand:- start:2810 stop:3520 length:711 start_codon:yes stop_codon:yes gene_type:complete
MLQNLKSLSKEDFESGKVILINKEEKWTSFDVVKKIKNLLKEKFLFKKIKVGHAGTLDPLATGLLIVCIGKATKKISDFQNLKKTYSGELTLGATTPSFDLETNVNKTYDLSKISDEKILKVKDSFIGENFQKPPIYSAIKVDGERLYKKARRGDKIEVKRRKVFIYDFQITDISVPKVSFEITCSKGTYIRSIANDFGHKLENGAYLSMLKRDKIGEYSVNDAVTVEGFKNELNQ